MQYLLVLIFSLHPVTFFSFYLLSKIMLHGLLHLFCSFVSLCLGFTSQLHSRVISVHGLNSAHLRAVCVLLSVFIIYCITGVFQCKTAK